MEEMAKREIAGLEELLQAVPELANVKFPLSEAKLAQVIEAIKSKGNLPRPPRQEPPKFGEFIYAYGTSLKDSYQQGDMHALGSRRAFKSFSSLISQVVPSKSRFRGYAFTRCEQDFSMILKCSSHHTCPKPSKNNEFIHTWILMHACTGTNVAANARHKGIQAFIEGFEYNYTGENFYNVKVNNSKKQKNICSPGSIIINIIIIIIIIITIMCVYVCVRTCIMYAHIFYLPSSS
jgi:hypothetical protein